MIPRCCAQILPDGVNRGIGKPFMECLHDKLSRDITADVILESYVPSKVLKWDLGNGCTSFDMDVCICESLPICDKVSDTFTDLEDFFFAKIKLPECVSGVLQYGL